MKPESLELPQHHARGGFFHLYVWIGALVIGSAGVSAQQPKENHAQEVATQLEVFGKTIATEVTAMLKTNMLKTSYTTVWRQFEDAAIGALETILPRHVPALSATNFDSGNVGREKNRLADLAVVVGEETIEISIKAARRSANPENDMGTFHDHPNRAKIFADSFTLWVRYEDASGMITCDRVFFDRTWRFVGKSSLVDGVKYRKKDGNMRPKGWAMFDSGEAFWKTEAEFEAAVNRSETYRANELIKEHLQDLSEQDQRLLYERLREKFASPSSRP
jgi:hypothetical protein